MLEFFSSALTFAMGWSLVVTTIYAVAVMVGSVYCYHTNKLVIVELVYKAAINAKNLMLSTAVLIASSLVCYYFGSALALDLSLYLVSAWLVVMFTITIAHCVCSIKAANKVANY